MLMNIETLQWDSYLFDAFGIPMSKIILPAIKPSAHIYGTYKDIAKEELPFHHVPIASAIGDQQSATIGQMCFTKGSCKNTYGTGCFLLMNVGEKPIQSSHGLLTTVLYQLNNEKPVYALEGAVAVAGSGVEWLKNNLVCCYKL